MGQPFDLHYGFQTEAEKNFLAKNSVEDLKQSFKKEANILQAVVVRKYHHENKNILQQSPLLSDIKQAVGLQDYEMGLAKIKKPTGTESIYAIQMLGIHCVQEIKKLDKSYLVDYHLKNAIINAGSSTDGILGPNTLSFLQDVAIWDGNADGKAPELSAIASWNGVVTPQLVHKMLRMCGDDVANRVKLQSMIPKQPGVIEVSPVSKPQIEKLSLSPDEFKKQIELEIAEANGSKVVVSPANKPVPNTTKSYTEYMVSRSKKDKQVPVSSPDNEAEALQKEFNEAERQALLKAQLKSKEEPVVKKEEPKKIVEEPVVKKEEPVVKKEEPVVKKEEPKKIVEEPVVVPVIEKSPSNSPVGLTAEQKKEMEEMEKLLEKKKPSSSVPDKNLDDVPSYNGNIDALNSSLLYMYLQQKHVDVEGVSVDQLLDVVKQSGSRGKVFLDTLLTSGSIAQAEKIIDPTKRTLVGATVNNSSQIDAITLLNIQGLTNGKLSESVLFKDPKYADLLPILRNLSDLGWYVYLSSKSPVGVIQSKYLGAFERRGWIIKPSVAPTPKQLTAFSALPLSIKKDVTDIVGIDMFDANKLSAEGVQALLGNALLSSGKDDEGRFYDYYAIKDRGTRLIFDKNYHFQETVDKSQMKTQGYYETKYRPGAKYTLEVK